MHRSLNSCNGTYAIDIPLWEIECRVATIIAGIFSERPVGDTMSRGVESGHQAYSRWRADTARVGIGEFRSGPCEFFHVRSAKTFVQHGTFLVERNRGVLPPHVIHQEQNDVRFVLFGNVFSNHLSNGKVTFFVRMDTVLDCEKVGPAR